MLITFGGQKLFDIYQPFLMKYFWTLYILMLTNAMVMAQIERGSIVSSLGGNFMIHEEKKNTSLKPAILVENQFKQKTINWGITTQGRYFVSNHWQVGIYLGYGMNRFSQKFSYTSLATNNNQNPNNFIYRQTRQYTSSYKAGPSLGFLSGSKFRTSLFFHIVPYVFYYKTKMYYDNNISESMESNDGLSYGVLVQPAIWYSLSERFILEFAPIMFNLERPIKKDATSDLSFKASFQVISFTINYQIK